MCVYVCVCLYIYKHSLNNDLSLYNIFSQEIDLLEIKIYIYFFTGLILLLCAFMCFVCEHYIKGYTTLRDIGK